MPAVPSSTDSITDLPFFLVWADSYNMTDDFVTWGPRATSYQTISTAAEQYGSESYNGVPNNAC